MLKPTQLTCDAKEEQQLFSEILSDNQTYFYISKTEPSQSLKDNDFNFLHWWNLKTSSHLRGVMGLDVSMWNYLFEKEAIKENLIQISKAPFIHFMTETRKSLLSVLLLFTWYYWTSSVTTLTFVTKVFYVSPPIFTHRCQFDCVTTSSEVCQKQIPLNPIFCLCNFTPDARKRQKCISITWVLCEKN